MILRCPQCKHAMKYQAMNGNLEDKRKTCVYCNRSFSVKSNILAKQPKSNNAYKGFKSAL